MDERLMMALSDPVFWGRLGAGFGAGAVCGFLYFQGLWWQSRLLAGGRPGRALLLTAGRLVLLGGALALAVRAGALPLLAMPLGILVARTAVIRRVRRIAL
jgi:F1F0 ATPase subunit 2